MAKILEVKYENKADATVFEVPYESQADLCWHEAHYPQQAAGDALWCFVQYDEQASFRVFRVKHEKQAALKIFKVPFANKAGWRNTDHALREKLG